MNNYLRLIITFLLLFLLQGCTKENKTNWLTENSCDLPCWNGVIVGDTTKTELLLKINNLTIIDQNKTRTYVEPWKIFTGSSFFTYYNRKIHGTASYLNEITEELTFSGELRTTFGDIVSEVGYPDYVIVIPLFNPTSNLDVTALYPTLGIAFSYDIRTIPKRMREEISPDIPIDYVTIFDPNIYDALVDASLFGQSLYNGEETRESLRPWDGYGVLLEKYPAAKKQR